MIGAVVIVLVVVIVIPVGLLVTGGIAAGVVGGFLRRGVETDHEGSELLDLN